MLYSTGPHNALSNNANCCLGSFFLFSYSSSSSFPFYINPIEAPIYAHKPSSKLELQILRKSQEEQHALLMKGGKFCP